MACQFLKSKCSLRSNAVVSTRHNMCDELWVMQKRRRVTPSGIPTHAQAAHQRPQYVDRPVPSTIGFLRLTRQKAMPSLTSCRHYLSLALRRIAVSGHDVSQVIPSLVRLPDSLHLHFEECLGSFHGAMKKHQMSFDDAIHKAGIALRPASTPSLDQMCTEQAFLESRDALDSQHDVGYAFLNVDSGAERRTSVMINSAMSRIYGMHREEFLMRLADSDLPIQYLDMDFLCLILHLMLQVCHFEPSQHRSFQIDPHLGAAPLTTRHTASPRLARSPRHFDSSSFSGHGAPQGRPLAPRALAPSARTRRRLFKRGAEGVGCSSFCIWPNLDAHARVRIEHPLNPIQSNSTS